MASWAGLTSAHAPHFHVHNWGRSLEFSNHEASGLTTGPHQIRWFLGLPSWESLKSRDGGNVWGCRCPWNSWPPSYLAAQDFALQDYTHIMMYLQSSFCPLDSTWSLAQLGNCSGEFDGPYGPWNRKKGSHQDPLGKYQLSIFLKDQATTKSSPTWTIAGPDEQNQWW